MKKIELRCGFRLAKMRIGKRARKETAAKAHSISPERGPAARFGRGKAVLKVQGLR